MLKCLRGFRSEIFAGEELSVYTLLLVNICTVLVVKWMFFLLKSQKQIFFGAFSASEEAFEVINILLNVRFLPCFMLLRKMWEIKKA